MIARISGKVLEASPLQVVIDAGGIGYEIHVPVGTAGSLPAVGGSCSLWTHAVYREDSQTLYGFASRDERDFFRLMIERVSGIGPRIAVSMLSRMPAEALRAAIASGDIALLAKCPGIGKKTAERLVIELKDKVFAEIAAAPGSIPTGAEPEPVGDAIASLVTLGYKPADADKLVRKAVAKLGKDASIESLIRTALA